VISPAQQEELYGRDLRNVVRIDFGKAYPGDVAGQVDVYTRAAAHLRSWMTLGLLVRDERPGLYLVSHEFEHPRGAPRRRLGLMGRVPALPWERSEVRPHELTLRGPKEDRLALMRATRAQTSPVWLLWDRAPGLSALLQEIAQGRALLGGRFEGEGGPEKVLLWQVTDEADLAQIASLLAPANLYIADGHHRFETMAAYAAERRAAGDPAEADSQYALVYATAADDPALVVLPIHRMVRPRPGLPADRDELRTRLDGAWQLEPAADPLVALAEVARWRAEEHACVLVAPDGAGVLRRPRVGVASRRDALDVSVLQSEVIGACGIGEAELREGALAYTRDASEAVEAVRRGEAALALLLSPCTGEEVMAVAAAGENMPQKSTYFYPKVPTGLVISPV
jgi:uncharacterized protein (DUF1015 family)